MTLFIICHDSLPRYRVPDGARIMWMSPVAPPPTDLEVVTGYDFFEQPERLHARLSGGLGSMAVHGWLSRERPGGTVTIWQYRKFVTDRALGTPSLNYPGMSLVPEVGATILDLVKPVPAAPHVLIAQPLKVGNLARQYERSHNVVDLLRYTALAIDTGVLAQKRTTAFLNETLLVPGGIELGTYPVDWWLPALDRLARVSLAFLDQHTPHDEDDPYQRRAVAFCQERLGSQLLLDWLREIRVQDSGARVIGVMHTVSEGSIYAGGS